MRLEGASAMGGIGQWCVRRERQHVRCARLTGGFRVMLSLPRDTSFTWARRAACACPVVSIGRVTRLRARMLWFLWGWVLIFF